MAQSWLLLLDITVFSVIYILKYFAWKYSFMLILSFKFVTCHFEIDWITYLLYFPRKRFL